MNKFETSREEIISKSKSYLNYKQGNFEEIDQNEFPEEWVIYISKSTTIADDNEYLYISSSYWWWIKNSLFKLWWKQWKFKEKKCWRIKIIDLQKKHIINWQTEIADLFKNNWLLNNRWSEITIDWNEIWLSNSHWEYFNILGYLKKQYIWKFVRITKYPIVITISNSNVKWSIDKKILLWIKPSKDYNKWKIYKINDIDNYNTFHNLNQQSYNLFLEETNIEYSSASDENSQITLLN